MAAHPIGDVLMSRQVNDRGLLQERLGDVLERMNEVLRPQVPLEPTVGDEFQACFEVRRTGRGGGRRERRLR